MSDGERKPGASEQQPVVENAAWTFGAERMLGDLLRSAGKARVDFRARRFRASDDVTDTDLQRAAHVIEFVYRVLCEPSRGRWAQLERAWQIVAYERRAELSDSTEQVSEAEAAEPAEAGVAQTPRHVPAAYPTPPLPTARAAIQGGLSPWTRQTSAEEESNETEDMASSSLDETSELDPAMFIDLAPTPFERPPPGEERARETFPQPVEESAAGDFAGETSAIAAIADVVAAYPLPVKLPMPLERYAALVAQTEGASAEELAELNRDYGVVDEAHRKRIDQDFSAALTRDVGLRQQFADHLRRGREWVKRQRGKP